MRGSSLVGVRLGGLKDLRMPSCAMTTPLGSILDTLEWNLMGLSWWISLREGPERARLFHTTLFVNPVCEADT